MFVRKRLTIFEKKASLSSMEIGDGNINYIYRVYDINSGKSVIVKQAGYNSRISADLQISTDRGRREVQALRMQESIIPGFVPKVYYYDEIMCAIIMEDMVNHEMMRHYLMAFHIHDSFAEDISSFLAVTAIKFSDLCLSNKQKKELVREFINPDLCEITENLVFTEPYQRTCGNNRIFYLSEEFVEQEIFSDKELHREVAKAKYEFMTKAQTLLHGDLHTGSIFINEHHIFIFDPEFAFFGPGGFDLGNMIANLFFAWCYADAQMPCNDNRKEPFCNWILDTIENIVDKFIQKFLELCNSTGSMEFSGYYGAIYLKDILRFAAASAGTESIRRVVGLAKVIELVKITDDLKRARAEKIILSLAKAYIKNSNCFLTGKDYINAIKKVIAKFS